MLLERSAGVLLHITSLPGKYGVGDLGGPARDFVDFLATSGQHVWQVLPLGPTGHGDSPYSCYSAFAGNPILVSIEGLIADGFLEPSQREEFEAVEYANRKCDYAAAKRIKRKALRLAFEQFRSQTNCGGFDAFESFCVQKRWWLDDFALFSALKEHFGSDGWTTWEPALAKRDSHTLGQWKDKLSLEIEFAQFVQYVFHKQWWELRSYAHAQEVKLFGDMPIFVAHGSSDVWGNQEEFCLAENGKSRVVAGVPPDYFSKTGQLWGNPLYDWEAMRLKNFSWWTQRFRAAFDLFDMFRIDHFRGFESYWEVPASAKTAVSGSWVQGPGTAPFDAARQELGELPIIAEDLGLITEEVHQLRDDLGFPGMRVLQFGFDQEHDDFHRPDTYPELSVAYTGTHDNSTIIGWHKAGKENALRQRLLSEYFDRPEALNGDAELHWRFVHMLYRSAARLAIVPMQDLLGFGDDARLNIPGQAEGNWKWRATEADFSEKVSTQLRRLCEMTQR